MKVAFELVGETPLLMHWDNIEGSDMLSEWRKAKENKNFSKAGDDRTPPWTWHTYCYNDGEKVAIPQDVLRGALLYGGTQIIVKGKKTFKELSQRGLLLCGEFLEFSFSDGKQLTILQLDKIKDKPFASQCEWCRENGFRLFVKRASIGSAKHVRVRPRFDKWIVRGVVEVLADEITLDILKEIFEGAGKAGLGDWRPNSPKRPGPYGQFVAKLKKV